MQQKKSWKYLLILNSRKSKYLRISKKDIKNDKFVLRSQSRKFANIENNLLSGSMDEIQSTKNFLLVDWAVCVCPQRFVFTVRIEYAAEQYTAASRPQWLRSFNDFNDWQFAAW